VSLEDKIGEVASALQKETARKMTPVTVSFIFGILIYFTVVLQGLQPPESAVEFGPFLWSWIINWWSVALKLLFLFVVMGGLNTLIFELWSRRQLKVVAGILAWDGDTGAMSRERVTQSLLALLDFPHRFIVRFIVQWFIVTPLLFLCLKIFYAFPWLTLFQIAMGVTLILSLMVVLHYFFIKDYYTRRLGEALRKYPTYFQEPALAAARVAYNRKILLYILVLVCSITWITTHISLSGQQRSVSYQRHEILGQRIDEIGPHLESSLERNESSSFFKLAVINILGETTYAYLLDNEGNNLLERDVPGEKRTTGEIYSLERSIMERIPVLDMKKPERSFGRKIKGLFFRPLVLRITDRIMMAYAGGEQYTVTVDPIGRTGNWHLVSIRPQAGYSHFLAQMGPVLAMFGVGLVLSLMFAAFMRREVMTPLARITDSSKRIESGDLSDPAPILADDEIGVLAVHHMRMASSVRDMVRQIGQAADSIETATEKIAERAQEMAHGSESQSVAVEETSATIAQMNHSIAEIAESVDTLASSAEESSASIIQMSATNEQVASSTENLSSGVEETTTSIQEMSASIKQVAENVGSAAEKTSETASSMHEMREAVKQVNDIAAETASVSEEVTRDSESGASAVQSTIAGIERIREIGAEAAQVIERLSKRAREIGRILTVIEDVTEETNLLALNAAIIAAQAGEHGRGFAVVADEIKDLAERTQASTSEIVELIRVVQSDAGAAVATVRRSEESVEEGVRLSGEAGEALRKIQESAKKSLAMARKISDSTREQGRQADQVLSFFENIAGMVEQIHTATQEQIKGSEQITLTAERMKDISVQVKKATREQALGGRQISHAIEHITEISSYINTSQAEQKRAAYQVLEAISQIAEIAHKNVDSVEKVTESVSNLKVLADDFKAMLDAFSLEEQEEKEPES
jgi:methyl-accepting chemotaxis protein